MKPSLDLESIGELLPNLDCYVDPSEARQACEELRRLSTVIRDLASYAEAKGNAMEQRLAGKIESARRFESAADSVYSVIPFWAKW